MHTIFRAAVLAAAAVAAGCTYTANVAPTSTPAAEVIPGRQLDYAVSQYFAPGMAELQRNASEGYICSAHEFPVKVGPALVTSIRTANDAAFARVMASDQPRVPAPGAERHLYFETESFQTRLNFASGFWSATAIGSAEIVFRVTAYDASGAEILRTMASGSGQAEASSGGCDGGAEALGEASRKAVQRAVESYVHKVVNAHQI